MKRLFIIVIIFGFLCSAGLAEEKNQHTPETGTKDEMVEPEVQSENCKKVCVKRDGYGLCLEFEERCEN